MAGVPELPADWSQALVVAAHPDDIEWGTSAAIAAWTAAGRHVEYLLATRGEAGISGLEPWDAAVVREFEERRAAAAVGVADVSFLDFADGHVEEGLPLRRAIAAAIREARPHVVVAINHRERWGARPGAPWNFPDHRAVGRAAIDAVYDAANEWIFPELAIDGAPAWRTRHVAISGSTGATHIVRVAPAQFERAVAALAAHRRYLEGLGIDDVHAYARTVVDNATILDGADRAVAFELLDGPGAS